MRALPDSPSPRPPRWTSLAELEWTSLAELTTTSPDHQLDQLGRTEGGLDTPDCDNINSFGPDGLGTAAAWDYAYNLGTFGVADYSPIGGGNYSPSVPQVDKTGPRARLGSERQRSSAAAS